MADIEALQLQMSADIRKFEKQMQRMADQTAKRLNQVEAKVRSSDKRLSRQMDRMGQNMVMGFRDGLRGMAPTLAAAFSTAAVLRYADAWTAGRNALAAAGVATNDLASRQAELVDIANESRTGTAETIALYQRLSIATAELGLSQARTLQLTELLNKSFQSSGLSTQEAASAALQLSQALASGTLQGDELRSLRENAPLVAKAIADAMGVGIGELKKLGAEGKITARVIVDALFAASAQIEGTFAKTSTTVGQALTILNNQLGKYVGQTDASLSATERMALGIILLSENLDTVVKVVAVFAALVGAKATLAVGAYTASLITNATAAVRLAAFQTAMTASLTGSTSAAVAAGAAFTRLNAAIAANPLGIAIVATAALTTGLIYLAHESDEARRNQEELSERVVEAEKVTGEYTAALADAATKTGREREEALKLAAAIRETTKARIDDIRVTAQQRIADVEAARVREAEAYRRVDNDRSRGPRRDPTAEINTLELLAARRDREAAEVAASAAVRAQIKAEQALHGADEGPARTDGAGGGGSVNSGTGTSSRDTESAREMLDLENAILAARAAGDEAAIEAAEERLLLAQTIQKYERAGYADAEARARQEINWLNQIEQREERRVAIAEALGNLKADATRRAEEAAEMVREENDILMDQLDLEAELARLRGDPAAMAAAERRYFIEQETNRLLSQRKDITEEQARAEATGRYDQLRAADIIGGLGRDDPASEAAALYEEVERLRQADLLSEEEAAQRRAQINAEYNAARLHDTRSMLDALAGLQNSSNKKLAAIGKAAAITQATIDGYLAVQKALASAPPPFNFVQAAIVGAATAANVASIAGMKDGGIVSGPGGPRDDKVPVMLSNGEFVNTASSVRQNRPWLEAMNNGARFEDLARRAQGMADGGLVGRINAMTPAAVAPRSAPVRHDHHVSIDVRGAVGNKEVARVASEAAGQAYRQAIKDAPAAVHRAASFKLGSGRRARR